MALSKDVYRELEDMLSPENLSEDPATLEGYAYQNNFGPVSTKPEDRYLPRPEAVALPGSTEEVQAIIRLCIRRGIKSKAFCTGYGPHNAVGGEGTIILDLRRMSRILEFDEKNMYIVVEPYVSAAQVHAEAMKRGLGCHIVAAGAQVSMLAGATSMHGNNFVAISNSYAGRNVLGVEWVLPTGELLRLGSLGSGAGWFSGDGPGPSLRGIMRGAAGAQGGLGVFTKCACHLHPWPGPKAMNTEGISPEYEAEVPPLCEYHIIEFPGWDQFADGMYKISEAGIAYALHKTGGPGSHGAYVTTTNNEYYERRQAGELLIPRYSLAIIMAAGSAGEHAYQVKVLDRILEETGGEISAVGEEPTFKKRDYMHMMRVSSTPRLCFRLTGTFGIDGLLGMDAIGNVMAGLKMDEVLRDKYEEKGVLMADGTNNAWATAFEGGHFALIEAGHPYDPSSAEACQGVTEMAAEGAGKAMQTPLAFSWVVMGDERVKMLGPAFHNVHDWMRKIKKVFDPHTVSDPSGYISAEEGAATIGVGAHRMAPPGTTSID
jgi:glycolate oxidase